MNKIEFLEQLERLLFDIPEQEREEALDFYKSYFEDAGEEQESQVIQELGSPGKVAAIIKADLEDQKDEYGEYTEAGYQDERFREGQMPDRRESAQQKTEENRYHSYQGYTGADHKHAHRGISWPLVIVIGLLGLCALPFLLGIGGTAIGMLVTLVVGIFSLIAGLILGGIGCLIGGVVGIVHSAMHLLSFPATAAATMGGSLLLLAAGLVCCLVFIWLVFRLFPVLFRWMVDLIQKLMHRGTHGGE